MRRPGPRNLMNEAHHNLSQTETAMRIFLVFLFFFYLAPRRISEAIKVKRPTEPPPGPATPFTARFISAC